MQRTAIAICLLLAAALAALVWFSRRPAAAHGGTLTVFCAAGLKQALEVAAADYQRECGTAVHLQFGGSGTLLSQVRIAKQGDLFIAADDGILALAHEAEVIREVLPLACQHPVIAVRSGNPKRLFSLADLLRSDVRVALANPEAASIGRATQAALGAQWEALASRATVMKPTVTEIASDLSLGTVDAAIVWDSTVGQFAGLECVEVPELKGRVENASAAVLASSTQAAAALRFARYLAAPEKGGAMFQQHGFIPAGGDRWEPRPTLILYSGGVNRPAIESLLGEFAAREGVEITTVFNGCGILCAAMKAMGDASNPKFPDAYYACDLSFIPPVAAQFPETTVLTETDIGIVVPKGNPRGVLTLADLAQPGLRLGLCNAEQSTLGYLTNGMLRASGLSAALRKNVAVEVPTADFLVNQMRANGLDAAIVYRVNARPQAAHLDYLPIAHPGAKAVQPFSIRAHSPNARLAARLLDFLKTRRRNFETAGFVWRGEEAARRSDQIEIPAWLRDAGSPPN
jgi:molybdenum ABC transporter molybdate-binding protein